MNSQHDYKKMYKQLKTENINLKQTIEIMTQESMEHMQVIEMQGHTIEELKRSVADLKHRLDQYDNFNTPSSMKKRSSVSGTKENSNMPEPKTRQSKLPGKQNGTADNVPKPRGGQTGHKGVTNKPEPTKLEERTPDACPECGLGKLSITKTIKQDITKVVRTITNITTRQLHKHVQMQLLRQGGHQAGNRSSKQRQLRFEHSDRGGRLLCVSHAVQNDRRL